MAMAEEGTKSVVEKKPPETSTKCWPTSRTVPSRWPSLVRTSHPGYRSPIRISTFAQRELQAVG